MHATLSPHYVLLVLSPALNYTERKRTFMFVGEAQLLLLLLLLLMLAHLFSTSHDIGSQLYGHIGSQL